MTGRRDIGERVFGMLLRAFPPCFRAEYGTEMMQLFRDRRRHERMSAVQVWAETIWDVATSAPALRLEALRVEASRMTGRQSHHHIREGTMKPMAMLAVVIGAVEAVNTLIEGWAGRANFGNEAWMLALSLGVVLSVLLVAVGVSLLRRGWDAAGWARLAAVGCLICVVIVRVAYGWMSVFATLLGVGFPLALLAYLMFARRNGPSRPMTA